MPPPTFSSMRRIARPIVALARLPEPNALVPPFMPISRAIGPLTTSSGPAMCVVAWTPLRLKALVGQRQHRRAHDRRVVRLAAGHHHVDREHLAGQPAIARRHPAFEKLRLAAERGDAGGDFLPVGGTTGSPSVQPCSKYHSTRSVPDGTREMVVVLSGMALSTYSPVKP